MTGMQSQLRFLRMNAPLFGYGYLNDKQLAGRYGVSRATIWRWVAKGMLPKPVQISPGTTRWKSDQIASFEAERAP